MSFYISLPNVIKVELRTAELWEHMAATNSYIYVGLGVGNGTHLERSMEYLNTWLIYYYFRFSKHTTAVLGCYLRFRLWPKYVIGMSFLIKPSNSIQDKPPPGIDREFEFHEFFSFLKFNEFYEFFFVYSQKIVILQIIDV